LKINTGTDHIKQWFVPVALQWQYEGNRAAVFIAFQDFYFATMLSGNFIYEREPKSGAAHSAASGFVYTEKRGENFFLIFRRNSDPGVRYFNEGAVCRNRRNSSVQERFFLLDVYRYFSTGMVVFNRIFHKIIHSTVEKKITSGDGTVSILLNQLNLFLLSN